MSTVQSEAGYSGRDSQIEGSVQTDPQGAASSHAQSSFRMDADFASEIEREVAAANVAPIGGGVSGEEKEVSGAGDGGEPRRVVARQASLLTEAQELMGDLAKMDTEIGKVASKTEASPEKRGPQSPTSSSSSEPTLDSDAKTASTPTVRAPLARKESVGVVLEPIGGGVGVSPASAEGTAEKEPLEAIAASPDIMQSGGRILAKVLSGEAAAKVVADGGDEGAGESADEGASAGEGAGEVEEKGDEDGLISSKDKLALQLRRSSSGGLTMSATNMIYAPNTRPGSATSIVSNVPSVPEANEDSPAAAKRDFSRSTSENKDASEGLWLGSILSDHHSRLSSTSHVPSRLLLVFRPL